MSTIRKVTAMALLAAVGAALGALAGEFLFAAAAPVPPRSICLLFDVSGSMRKPVDPRTRGSQSQLAALQAAATAFVGRGDLDRDALGLATFASTARIQAQLGRDRDRLVEQIGRLDADGMTDLAGGLAAAREVLAGSYGERWILLFSDGKPAGHPLAADPEQTALAEAARVREQGIGIVAIGTGLADEHYLRQVTGNAERVIISAPERLHEAFQRSGEYIQSRQLLASTAAAGTDDFRQNLERAGLWASLIAVGAALAMVAAQNRHLRRRILGARDIAVVLLGGVLTGALAGAAGQSLFYALADFEQLGGAARTVAWIVLGLGLGLGMSLFVPNLDRRRAAAGGIAGGIVAAFLFLVVVPLHGDSVGRLASAAALGLCTAIALLLLEVVGRKAWVVVHWSPRERSTLRLGTTPIVVGHGKHAHIRPAFVQGGAPVLAELVFADGKVMLTEPASGRRKFVRAGAMLEYGAIRVEVRVETGPAAADGDGDAAADDRARADRADAAPAPRTPIAPAAPKRARVPEPVGRGTPFRSGPTPR